MNVLIGFVLIVAGVIVRFLMDACLALPIDGRPLPLPPAIHSSQTNSIPSTEARGTILSIITNAEYFVEGDINRTTNFVTWETFSHFSFYLAEADGASASYSFEDGPVFGQITCTVSSGTPSATVALKPKAKSDFWDPSPPCAFYQLANLSVWRNEYYRVVLSSGSPYQQ